MFVFYLIIVLINRVNDYISNSCYFILNVCLLFDYYHKYYIKFKLILNLNEFLEKKTKYLSRKLITYDIILI